MRTVERSIGTTTRMVEIPFLIIDTLEKFDNIMITHLGWKFVPMQRTVDPTTFLPSILYMLASPDVANVNYGRAYVQCSLEYSVTLDKDYKNVLSKFYVDPLDDIIKLRNS